MRFLLKKFGILLIILSSNQAICQCQYSIYMVDTYGDSWNGGSIDVLLNGTPILIGETVLNTDNGGDWKIVNFSVNTGDDVTTSYTAGSWSGENEYYIYDAPSAGGNLLFSSGTGGSTPGNLVSGTVTANCPTCPDPSSLGASSISHNQANLSWVESGSATLWDIEIGTQGFSPSGTPTQSNISTTTYLQTGLSTSTDYDFYVRSNCGGGDYSNWSGPYTFSTTALTGQVFVTATVGTTSGTYSTLSAAFNKINDGTHQGEIILTVGANDGETIFETAEASLNKSGSGGASYSSVLVQPGAANITIKGSITDDSYGNCCLPGGIVSLNDAENVTFDGRQGASGSTVDLTIENTAVGTYASAFVFLNASNCELKYCKLKSSITSTSGGCGTISFKDNNASGGSGADNNVVEYCHVTKSGGNLPRRAIASDGNSTETHDNNVIRGCSIYDFDEYGIFLGNYSSSEGYNRDWIIEGNEIYQTQVFSGVTKNQAAICIGYPYSSSSSGYDEEGHFIIRNNSIGGNGAGGDWEWGTNSTYFFWGIYLNDGTSSHDPSEVYNNEVSDIKITSGNTYSSSLKPIVAGIAAYNCKVNIGTKGGNTIGSISDPSSIEIEKTGNGSYAAGIFVYSSSDLGNVINNNIVSGISGISGSSTLGTFTGIFNQSSTTYPTDSIVGNKVYNVAFSTANYFHGINGQGLIAKNSVRDIKFTGAASFSELVGIRWKGGEVNATDSRGVENNEVILGKDKDGNDIGGNDIIIGIEVTRGDADIHYNSVLIEGSHTGSENTYGFELPSTGTVNFYNNLMYNERSGGTGKHYAIYKTGSGVAFNSSNNAYVTGTTANNFLGNWTGTDQVNLSLWETSSGETNSIASDNSGMPVSTLFPLLSANRRLDVDDPTWLEAGTPLTNPTYDILNTLRNNITPTIGAYEKRLIVPLPIDLLSFEGHAEVGVNKLYWTTASEQNNARFIIERSQDGENWEYAFEQMGAMNSSIEKNYSGNDEEFYTYTFYRLIQEDYNGDKEVKGIITILNESTFDPVITYPNPTSTSFKIDFGNREGMEDVVIKVMNCLGRVVFNMSLSDDEIREAFEIDVQDWSAGNYILIIDNEGRIETKKIIVTR